MPHCIHELEQLRIHVDTFHVDAHYRDTFILTHSHTDHTSIPNRFHGIVLAMEMESEMDHTYQDDLDGTRDDPRIRRCLRPGRWYHTDTFGVAFLVFRTWHAPDSIGIYVPEAHVLYMGDSHMPVCMIHAFRDMFQHHTITRQRQPKTIVVYDDFHERAAIESRVRFGKETWVTTGRTPTHEELCQLLARAIERLPVVRCVHYGMLSGLLWCGRYCVSCDDTLPPVICRFVRMMRVHAQCTTHDCSEQQAVRLVGSTYRGAVVVPSVLWFIHTGESPYQLHRDGSNIRVFCTMHATLVEIEAWKRELSNVCTFHPLGGSRIWRNTV
jgi:hypothetical protein